MNKLTPLLYTHTCWSNYLFLSEGQMTKTMLHHLQ